MPNDHIPGRYETGRIRLDKEAAFYLNDVLDMTINALLLHRQGLEYEDEVAGSNAQITSLRRIKTELARTIVEMGWYKPPVS